MLRQRVLQLTQASTRLASPSDRAAVCALLAELELPLAGVDDGLSRFVVAEREGRVIGVAGLELYRDGALLRSVAVFPSERGTGLGGRLVETVLRRAGEAGVRDVYLLTTTAERYFPRFGFTVIPRELVPESVRGSVEFRSACPASAVAMHRALDSISLREPLY